MVFHQPFNSLSGSYNVRFFTDQSWSYHFHKNPEILCVLRGSVDVSVGGVERTLHEGEFAMCLSLEIHAYTPHPDSRYWVCVFSEDYVGQFARTMEGRRGSDFRFVCSDTVRNYVRGALIEAESVSVYTLKSCLYALCGEYLGCVELVRRDSAADSMSAVLDFVRENHRHNLRLSDVAEKLGYDYHYVSRFFRTAFRMTFRDYLKTCRLESAVLLLRETDKKIVEISLESGFQSVRAFNQAFREHYGISPSEYRKISEKKFLPAIPPVVLQSGAERDIMYTKTITFQEAEP